jgi:alkylation response protein AidB-like acyl-CoA dehydrogenase
MPPAASLSLDPDEARAFAESVAGLVDRHAPVHRGWEPGALPTPPGPELAAALSELGWDELSRDPQLVACAGLGGVELGRRLAPVRCVDRLLGGGPIAGGLVRSLGPGSTAVIRERGAVLLAPVLQSEPVATADGLDLRRVLELGEPVEVAADRWRTAERAWLAAGVGYLAGLGEGALEMTQDYVRQRHAFGSTLAALAPVQQLLAEAATAVRGVRLLAGAGAGAEPLAYGDALAHAGPAVTRACAACQQATGAIGFTLEYPLQRHTQLARALAAFNDALLDTLISPGA